LSSSKIAMVVGECDYPSNYDGFKYLNTEDHPIECATCELVIHALENWLIDPADEQAVAVALDAICKAIPGGNILSDNFPEECSYLVCTYWDDIIELIVQDYPPKSICTAINVCP
jgi:hypothetical protein